MEQKLSTYIFSSLSVTLSFICPALHAITEASQLIGMQFWLSRTGHWL